MGHAEQVVDCVAQQEHRLAGLVLETPSSVGSGLQEATPLVSRYSEASLKREFVVRRPGRYLVPPLSSLTGVETQAPRGLSIVEAGDVILFPFRTGEM